MRQLMVSLGEILKRTVNNLIKKRPLNLFLPGFDLGGKQANEISNIPLDYRGTFKGFTVRSRVKIASRSISMGYYGEPFTGTKSAAPNSAPNWIPTTPVSRVSVATNCATRLWPGSQRSPRRGPFDTPCRAVRASFLLIAMFRH